MNIEEVLNYREWGEAGTMVAIWVVAGLLYMAFIAVTGNRGYPGVAGLALFVLIVIFSPRIAAFLESSLLSD